MLQILVIHPAERAPRELLKELSPVRAEVVQAAGADAGLSTALRVVPALVIVCIDGPAAWTLVRAIKSDVRTRDVPVMAFRNTPSSEDKRAAKRSGCAGYDCPPLKPTRLRAKVAALLESSPRTPLRALGEVETQGTRQHSQGRVLVVDHDPEVRSTLSRRLSLVGYQVQTAANGAQALEAVAATRFDLMLLDLKLSGQGGLEVLWRVRERFSSDELPVLVMSGRARGHDVTAALEVGANDYLTRPIDGTLLLGRVAVHMALRRKANALAKSEALYRLLTENSTDMVTRSTPEGTWTFVSPACRDLLGMQPEELVGRSAYDLIHPDDFAALATNHEALGDSEDMFALRYRMQRADQSWGWFETNLNAIRDAAGEVVEIQGATRDVTTQVERQAALTEEMMVRFARIAEFRSGETSGHIQRMSRSCALLAEKAGSNTLECEEIRLAATLHDFGNILIPMQILHKEGRLTPEEFAVVKRGPELGYELLKGSGNTVLERAATISWYHHEHWDGSGYPRGKRGRGIPLEGRIALICDVFDMMTSRRPYREALPVDDVLEQMRGERGTRFDPKLLDLFLRQIDDVLALRVAFPDPA